MENKIEAKIRQQIIKGIAYLYEDYPYWDKDKGQIRHKRIYIGKVGENGETLYNKSYQSRQSNIKSGGKKETINQSGLATRKYYGAIYLLNHICERIGLIDDLKSCFPKEYDKMLSLAYFLVLENESPMYRFEKWSYTHEHPYGNNIPSQRISDIFSYVAEDAKLSFFKLRSSRCLKNEYLAYDTTSISSYSQLIDQVKYGYNKDLESLPQINLALVYGEESMLPIYYRKLAGNITDVSTVRKLLKDVEFLNIIKVKLIMDRGFYSAENINALYHNHCKFIVGVRNNNKYAINKINEVRERIKDYSNYSLQEEIYCTSNMEKWDFEYKNHKGTITEAGKRRIYTHVYYDGQRAESEKANFVRELAYAEEAVRNNAKLSQSQEELIESFFVITSTSIRGKRIEYKEESIRKRIANFGYFVLISNEVKDPVMALSLYRNKDLIEKAFWNLKNRLSMRRTSVYSYENLEGKLFIQFIALILVSYIDQQMKKFGLYKNYTMTSLLDELDIIERFAHPNSLPLLGEVTKKQILLLSYFGLSF